MPEIRDFRSDFRRGRTGDAVRIRQDAKSYTTSVRDALNMMVLSDGQLSRRWGTFNRGTFSQPARLESWEFSTDHNFIMMFTDGAVEFFTPNMVSVGLFTNMPWDNTTKNYMSFASERSTLFICDQSFRTVMFKLEFTQGNPSFSWQYFEFSVTADDTRLNAPFFSFEPEIVFSPTIFTSAGASTGYGPHIATAMGFAASTFNMSLGTGDLSCSAPFFSPDHAGSRLRLLSGEVEVTQVVDAQNAKIRVVKDLAQRLETNPFYLRKDSNIVEVTYFDHGLQVGDELFFVGLDNIDSIATILTNACLLATSGTAAPAPSGGAATYVVKRVVDANTLEITGNAAATQTILTGGADVYAFRKNGMKNAQEPVMSNVRGWPTACTVHERRLWVGGTTSLPNAVWASQFFDYTNFDTGEGNLADAIAMYGLGKQSRVRHLVSGYDLVIFTDKEELYVPGASIETISQSTVRAVSATESGASYTQPHKFDGGIFYVDIIGTVVREFAASSRDTEYSSMPASIVINDWVQKPRDAGMYRGSNYFGSTAYLFFADQDDGSMLVMHSSRGDESFGWMRWELHSGRFISVTAVNSRLFAFAEHSGVYYMLEFDTQNTEYITTDFTEQFVDANGRTSWTSSSFFNEIVQVENSISANEAVLVDGSGNFQTSASNTFIRAGRPMPWSCELHAPVAVRPNGPAIGRTQRLVSAEINWDRTTTGRVSGQPVVSPTDINQTTLLANPVDEWRQYWIGEWGREPTLVIEGNEIGQVGIRGLVLNVYV